MRVLTSLLLLFGGIASAEATTLTGEQPPIVVTLGDDTVRARFMWLDYGQIAKNTVKTITLGITNVTARPLQVGAFSISNTLRSRWIDSQLQPLAESTCNILPGERRSLLVEALFVDTDEQMKVISLMSSGVELVEIVAKEIIQPSERVALSVDQMSGKSPHPFWFSGQGEWWSDWYVLSLGASPPGYKLDPSSARAIVSTAQNDHPRSCGYYTHCEWVHLSDEDVSARFSVMGHHKGDWTGDTNISVRFKAKVSAEYTLIESLKLSAADFSVLEAKAVLKKPVSEKIAATSLGSLGTASYGGSFGLGADKGYTPPRPPDLAVLQPELYKACDKVKAEETVKLGTKEIFEKNSGFDSCVQLGMWTYDVNGFAGYDQALNLFTKACDGKIATGCTHLGDLLVSNGSEATGIPKLELGCELGDGLACYILGEMNERGLNTSPNLSAAKRYFGQACKNKFPAPGCSKTKVSKRIEF